MYKIPKDFDIYSIKEKTISQIGFGSNFITFFFDGGYIQISGNFEYSYLGNSFMYTEIYPISSDLGLLRLLDKRIINVSYTEDSLILTFDNNDVLTFKGDDMYESYSICLDGRRVIV